MIRRSNIIRYIEFFLLSGLFLVMSCQKSEISGKWNLTFRTGYRILCSDFEDTTNGKHYNAMEYVDALLNDPNLNEKVVRKKFDTTLVKVNFNSENKNIEQIEFNKNLTFSLTLRIWDFKYFLHGTYSISNNTVILYALQGIDICQNRTQFDTIDRICIRCDDIDNLISIHDIIPNNPIIAILKSKDSLIIRDTFRLGNFSMVDYAFVRHNKKGQEEGVARKTQ